MALANITVEKILEHQDLSLRVVSGHDGLSKKIVNSEINRPGLSLTGFFDFFAYDRVQIFGKGEWAYLNSVSREQLTPVMEKFFSYNLVAIIFTHNNPPLPIIQEFCERKDIPLMVSSLSTRDINLHISDILNKSLAPRTIKHGVLIEVFGIGILLTGKSGIGKSETALELIERGHRLVADDMVELKKYPEGYLLGTCSDIIRHHMEIRGLGIINIKDLFGAGSVRDQKKLELIINILDWKEEAGHDHDRTGLDEDYEEILGIRIPLITIPLRPGRNLPIIVETASMNQRLKKMGKYTAREFSDSLYNKINRRKFEKNQSQDQ
jgi:HPr kinase/phosphorylase